MEEKITARSPRRRRHSDEFKAEVVKACLQPGVSTAAVALRYGLNANLLRRWIAARAAHDETAGTHTLTASAPDEFVALPLPALDASAMSQEIVIEVRRGATAITVRWPQSSAIACAHWLQGWLR